MGESMQGQRAESKGRQPELAAGQVWRFPSGHERTIEGFEEGGLLAKFRGSLATWSRGALLATCSCIGIETPAGRVMVGERRHDVDLRGTVGELRHVESGAHVGVHFDDGDTVQIPAKDVARWPLVPGPLAEAAKEAGREPSRTIASHSTDATPTKTVGRMVGARLTAPPPDPRAAREQRRREIDAVLAADARQHPAFATARRCAVMAWEEDPKSDTSPDAVGYALRALRRYEDARGGARRPAVAVAGGSLDPLIFAAYETRRHL